MNSTEHNKKLVNECIAGARTWPRDCEGLTMNILADAVESQRAEISRLEARIQELEQGLKDIKSGKNNPCYIVDCLINKPESGV